MKACLAWLCVLIPLISSLALPEPNPASVIPVVVTDLEHTKRDAAPPGKRTVHGVYFCINGGFKPPCEYIPADGGVCVGLGNTLEDKISAVGPDQGAYCRFYFDRGCSDSSGWRHFDTQYPGIEDLSKYGDGGANDQVSSYMCWDL